MFVKKEESTEHFPMVMSSIMEEEMGISISRNLYFLGGFLSSIWAVLNSKLCGTSKQSLQV